MNFFWYALGLVVVLQFFFAIPITLAAESGGDSSASGIAQLAGCSGPNCTACNLVNLANGIIKWLIGIVFLLFVVLTTVAGVRMVMSGGNHHALDEAKGLFTNAIIGLIIILSAWLIVDTIMRTLLGDGNNPKNVGSLNYGGVTGWLYWSEVQCQVVRRPEYDPNNTLQLTMEAENPSPPASTAIIGSHGYGNTAIIAYADAMDAKQCQYSQGKRNSCNGTPGFTDCSGLVDDAYRSAGCRSPGSNTANMYPIAVAIGNRSTLREGDAIVVRHGNEGHVVLCRNTGCNSVIHASGRGAQDGNPATIAPQDQIKISDGSIYVDNPEARVIRAADYCPVVTPRTTGPQ